MNRDLFDLENKFKTLTEHSLVGVFLIQDGVFKYVNPRLSEIFGYTTEEMIDRMRPVDLVHQEDLPVVEENIRKQLTGEIDLINYEFRGIRKEKEIIYVEAYNSRTIYQGRPAIIGNLLNVTKRKLTENSMKEAQTRLLLAIKASNIGLWEWDLMTNKVYFSQEWKRQIGYEDWEISDNFSEWQSRVHPDDLERILRKINEYIKNPLPDYEAEFRFRHKNGSYRWIMARASLEYDKDGNPIRMLGSHIDITDRKKIEEELFESERKYRELVQNANSIILRWTPDGYITFINEFGQRFFGYSEKEIIGRHVVGTIVPETESTSRDLRLLMEKICADPRSFEKNVNDNIRRDGTRVWIAWTNKVITDEYGQIKELLSIGTDITELKKAKEDLQKHRENLEYLIKERTIELEQANIKLKEIDRLKSMFIASMSYELRTPLNSIIGFSSILLNEWKGILNDHQREFLSIILRAGKHLLALINDVIDVSKIEAGMLEPYFEDFELSDVIKEAVSSLEKDIKEKGLELKVESIYQHMHTDKRRLLQCVLNLLSNAMKFTDKGTITVQAQLVSSRTDQVTKVEEDFVITHCHLIPKSDFVEISVADTGIGINEKDIPNLFKAFVRVDSPLKTTVAGTGLGLYLTKKLVTEALKGEISVESNYGAGSRFMIRIPINAEPCM